MLALAGTASTLRAGVVNVLVASGAVLTAASVAAPWAVGAPIPVALDLAVPVALLVVAATAAVWRAPAVALAGAAGVWSATAMSGYLPMRLGAVIERVAVWPHTAVVIAVLCLPFGTLGGARWTLALGAGALGVLGSVGAGVPVLALLGIVLMGGAVSWWPRRAATPIRWALGVQLALGVGWCGVDLLGGRLAVRALADLVDVLIVVSAVVVAAFARQAGKPAGGFIADELGRRVGAVLGTAPVTVQFATAVGWVDVTGLSCALEGPSQPISIDGRAIALVSASGPLPPSLRRVLARDLAPLAAIAELNAERRHLATQLAASRRRLAEAADAERHSTEEALTHTVVARLNRIQSCLAADGLDSKRLALLREQLAALVADLDPLGGRTLGEGLQALSGQHGCDVPLGLEAPPEVARAAWWIASEAIANARKHAPGSRVLLSASRIGRQVHVRVSDDGPGGADPNGRGLLGIADRAAILGGTLTIRSDARGTVVAATLPCTIDTRWPVGDSRANTDPAPRQRPYVGRYD